jgi:hypothetical protein
MTLTQLELSQRQTRRGPIFSITFGNQVLAIMSRGIRWLLRKNVDGQMADTLKCQLPNCQHQNVNITYYVMHTNLT